MVDLCIVGCVNDLVYGNVDVCFECMLMMFEEGYLCVYCVDFNGVFVVVVFVLYHGGDCGVSFVVMFF